MLYWGDGSPEARTLGQARMQLGLWAIMKSPILFASQIYKFVSAQA